MQCASVCSLRRFYFDFSSWPPNPDSGCCDVRRRQTVEARMEVQILSSDAFTYSCGAAKLAAPAFMGVSYKSLIDFSRSAVCLRYSCMRYSATSLISYCRSAVCLR